MKSELAALRRELEAMHARVASLEGKGAAPAPAPTPGMGEVPPAPSTSTPKSPSEILIETYLAYTDAELQDPSHAVKLEMVLAIVGKEDVPQEVRKQAAEAVTRVQTLNNDPTLGMTGEGEARPRVKFSRKVLTLLLDADVFVRGLAKSIIEGLWGGWGSRVKDLRNCDARDLDSCFKASKAWEEVFRK